MHKILLFVFFSSLFIGCSLFENKEKKAIEICQKAKVQFNVDNAFLNLFLGKYGLAENSTWLDFANTLAKNDPNKKYDWHAKRTDDKKFYIVDFVDSSDWGHRWEVDIDQQIVKSINQNDYLTRKYGLSRLDNDNEFIIQDEIQSALFIGKKNSSWDIMSLFNPDPEDASPKIMYVMEASAINKTDKVITSANISGSLKLIFKDKTIVGASSNKSEFKIKVSKRNPWLPNTARKFYIKTKGIDKIYLNYVPEYVVFDISMKAEDPVGYTYDKDISEVDLKDKWVLFKKSSSDSGAPTPNHGDLNTKKQKSLSGSQPKKSNPNNDYVSDNSDPNEIYNHAVDQINCRTITFIHREVGRAEVANNLDCSSFDEIFSSIPGNEANSMGVICSQINDFKDQFKEGISVSVQLDAVIKFAYARIAAKERKGRLDDFKASLEKIKKDAGQ